MREQGRQNFLKGDARQDAIIPGQRREGGGGASARDGSVSGPGPARPERGRGHSESESQSENRAEKLRYRQKKLVETGEMSAGPHTGDDHNVEHDDQTPGPHISHPHTRSQTSVTIKSDLKINIQKQYIMNKNVNSKH